MILEFTVPGEPLPKMRPRVRGRVAYTPKPTRDAEERVRAVFREAFPGWVPVARGTSIMLSAAYYRRTMRAVDLDNLLKTTLDALTGLVWEDDSQVSNLSAIRLYGAGDDARTNVRVLVEESW